MDGILSYIIDALYSLPGILVGLSFHEWGHAYAAYKRGDPTARNLGRMTVNPLAHIDPLGFPSPLVRPADDDHRGLRLGQARTREHAQL